MALKKIKEQNKDYDLSILDLLRILDPSKTGKFMNLLLNELKSIPQNEVGEDYENSLGLYLEGMVGVNKILITYLVELLGGAETIRCMGKFLEFSEKEPVLFSAFQENCFIALMYIQGSLFFWFEPISKLNAHPVFLELGL